MKDKFFLAEHKGEKSPFDTSRAGYCCGYSGNRSRCRIHWHPMLMSVMERTHEIEVMKAI
jgi:hypothetical protein